MTNGCAALRFTAGQHTKKEKSIGSPLAACLKKCVTKGDKFKSNSAGTNISWSTPNLFLSLEILLLSAHHSF
jgi:hypothetical protein